MELREDSKENGTIIKINDVLTIYEVAAIHKKLLQSFSENTTVNIDLSNVTFCDVAGIQLLFAAIKTGEKEEKEITISKVSETVRKTARLAGVQQDILNGIDGGQ